MPTGPVNSVHDLVLQDPNTGAVDYLQFSGTTLTQSKMIDYGIGGGFHIGASADFNGDGFQDLLVQNTTSHLLDFLYLDNTGKMIASATSSPIAGTVVGEGNFGGFAGQAGPTVVSQLADGTIDLLGYDGSGHLVGSQTIAGTTGLAHIVAVGGANIAGGAPAFAGVGTGINSNIVIQLGDGTLDVLGFGGGTPGPVTLTSSLAIQGSAGLGKVVAMNQDFGNAADANILGGNGTQTAEFVTQSADGHSTNVFVGTGYGGTTEGQIFAQDAFAQAFPGLNVVDAGHVAHGTNNTGFFPIT